MSVPSNTVVGASGAAALRGSGVVSFIRPLNTTAYTAGDVVSDNATNTQLLKFPLARAAGGGGYVVRGWLATNSKTFLSQMRLYLLSVQYPPGLIVGDNVAGTQLYANMPVSIGYIDFPVLATGVGSGSTASVALFTGAVEFRCADGDDSIYGYLVDNTGSTPTSGQLFSVMLEADVYA